jgi:hypothetical protein
VFDMDKFMAIITAREMSVENFCTLVVFVLRKIPERIITAIGTNAIMIPDRDEEIRCRP